MIINNHLFGDRCPTLTDHATLYVCTAYGGLVKTEKTIRLCKIHEMTPVYCLSTYILRTAKSILKSYAHKYSVNRSVLTNDKYYIHLTSGLKALLFTMLICRQVHVFGFGKEGTEAYSYFSNDTAYKPPYHEMSLEMRIIRDIANRTFNSSLLNLTDEVFGTVQLHQ